MEPHNKNNDENKDLILSCACYVELLRFHKYSNGEDVYVTYYGILSFNNKSIFKSLWERLLIGFKYIFRKKVVFAELVLDTEGQKKLKNWLNEINEQKMEC